MGDVAARLLTMLAILQKGDGAAGDELARRLGTTTRTVRSDVDRLRRMGHVVTSKPGHPDAYRLMPGERLPPLTLDDHEAVATVVGLTLVAATADPSSPIAGGAFDSAASDALAMIDRLLPERLRRRAQAEWTRVQPFVRTPRETDSERLAALPTAISGRIVVRLLRTRPDGVVRLESMEPYRLMFSHTLWFVVGFDFSGCGWMQWDLNDLDDVRLTPRRFGARILPPGRADRLRPHVLGTWHDGVLTVYADVVVSEDALHHQIAEVEAIAADRCQVRVLCTSWEPLMMRLALHGIDFRVEEPQALAEARRRISDRLRCASEAGLMGRTGETAPGSATERSTVLRTECSTRLGTAPFTEPDTSAAKRLRRIAEDVSE